jgi:hypothetical protein
MRLFNFISLYYVSCFPCVRPQLHLNESLNIFVKFCINIIPVQEVPTYVFSLLRSLYQHGHRTNCWHDSATSAIQCRTLIFVMVMDFQKICTLCSGRMFVETTICRNYNMTAAQILCLVMRSILITDEPEWNFGEIYNEHVDKVCIKRSLNANSWKSGKCEDFMQPKPVDTKIDTKMELRIV